MWRIMPLVLLGVLLAGCPAAKKETAKTDSPSPPPAVEQQAERPNPPKRDDNFGTLTFSGPRITSEGLDISPMGAPGLGLGW